MVAVVSIGGLLVRILGVRLRDRSLTSSLFQVAYLEPPRANCPPYLVLGVPLLTLYHFII